MYKKIMVPLDGSPLAEQILDQVISLARLTGAEIVLLRVAQAHAFSGVDPLEAEAKVVEAAQAYLDGIKDRLAGEGLNASSNVRYGHDAEEILAHAVENNVDLIAMGSHGQSGLGLWNLGSVSKRVVRHSPKPVLIVRAKEA